MLKYLGVGMIITIIAWITGFVTQDWNLFLIIIGLGALLPLIISGLLTGAFVDGDRNRANFHTETKEDRQSKNEWVKRFIFIGAPNAIVLVILVVIGLVNR